MREIAETVSILKEREEQWTIPGERTPKETKTVLSSEKVMAIGF